MARRRRSRARKSTTNDKLAVFLIVVLIALVTLVILAVSQKQVDSRYASSSALQNYAGSPGFGDSGGDSRGDGTAGDGTAGDGAECPNNWNKEDVPDEPGESWCCRVYNWPGEPNPGGAKGIHDEDFEGYSGKQCYKFEPGPNCADVNHDWKCDDTEVACKNFNMDNQCGGNGVFTGYQEPNDGDLVMPHCLAWKKKFGSSGNVANEPFFRVRYITAPSNSLPFGNGPGKKYCGRQLNCPEGYVDLRGNPIPEPAPPKKYDVGTYKVAERMDCVKFGNVWRWSLSGMQGSTSGVDYQSCSKEEECVCETAYSYRCAVSQTGGIDFFGESGNQGGNIVPQGESYNAWEVTCAEGGLVPNEPDAQQFCNALITYCGFVE